MRRAYPVQFVHRPGRRLRDSELAVLVGELRTLAGRCFDRIPEYQVVSGCPDALDRAVLTLARDRRGRLVGFCSALLLDVDGVGEVFHLGLTCVDPDHRGAGLTHVLLSRVVLEYVLRHRPLTGAWFSNVASVLSSLGNVALHFEDVHPSPFRAAPASPRHRAVALGLATAHRARIHLDPRAPFDAEGFVFRGANRGTGFAKAEADARYHHRDGVLNRWYADRLDLDGGDAQLQVGRISLAGFVRYALRKVTVRIPGLRRFTAAPAIGVRS